jgi:DNA-binding transcriptional MerR regulator
MPSEAKQMLKIGELAKESGFPVSTIRHYINEGLLGAPRKKSKNMAYYGRESIPRIGLIKRLQDELYLPLRLIKKILKPSSQSFSVEEMDLIIEVRQRLEEEDFELLPKAPRIPKEKILQSLFITEQELAAMEDMEIVSGEAKNGKTFYNELEYRIIKAYADARSVGFTSDLGFGVEDLLIYIQAIKDLVELESRVFIARMQRNPSAEKIADLIRQGLPAVDRVISSLHHKFMMDILEDMETEAKKL